MDKDQKVRHDQGCPFCKGTDGTVVDEGWDARRVKCDGCGAGGPREWSEALVIDPWKSDAGTPEPMWCTSCVDVIGDATFLDEVPITVKFRAHVKCIHEVSC